MWITGDSTHLNKASNKGGSTTPAIKEQKKRSLTKLTGDGNTQISPENTSYVAQGQFKIDDKYCYKNIPLFQHSVQDNNLLQSSEISLEHGFDADVP